MFHTISIKVSGKVQGVFFRQSTKEKARELGITGFVRNEADDTVLIKATGTEEQLEQLKDWCKTGPPKARVSGIEITRLPLERFDSFFIERF
jgi:acylphosphatase